MFLSRLSRLRDSPEFTEPAEKIEKDTLCSLRFVGDTNNRFILSIL
jgi:hypothetical protein